MSLSEHYARDVIGGPASFVMVAEGTGRFADAVRRKLIQEIALVEPVPQSNETVAR